MIWIRNQLDVTFVLSFISPLQVAQHVSGNHVPIFRSWRLYSVIVTSSYSPMDTHYLLTGSDSLPAATAQHQHVAITLRSRQLLKMGTWLPETCWATCKGEIKDNTKWHLVGFLSILNYDSRSTTHHIYLNDSYCTQTAGICALQLYITSKFLIRNFLFFISCLLGLRGQTFAWSNFFSALFSRLSYRL